MVMGMAQMRNGGIVGMCCKTGPRMPTSKKGMSPKLMPLFGSLQSYEHVLWVSNDASLRLSQLVKVTKHFLMKVELERDRSRFTSSDIIYLIYVTKTPCHDYCYTLYWVFINFLKLSLDLSLSLREIQTQLSELFDCQNPSQ